MLGKEGKDGRPNPFMVGNFERWIKTWKRSLYLSPRKECLVRKARMEDLMRINGKVARHYCTTTLVLVISGGRAATSERTAAIAVVTAAIPGNVPAPVNAATAAVKEETAVAKAEID